MRPLVLAGAVVLSAPGPCPAATAGSGAASSRSATPAVPILPVSTLASDGMTNSPPLAQPPAGVPNFPVSGPAEDQALIPPPRPRYVPVGESLVDTRARGAQAMLKALSFPAPRAVLGMFKPSSGEVINAFAQGTEYVCCHIQALPPEGEYDERDIGGYTFKLLPDGLYYFGHSGSVFAPITPRIERAILRHLGVTPARPSLRVRFVGPFLRGWDWVAARLAER